VMKAFLLFRKSCLSQNRLFCIDIAGEG
jgi:hypothetical protein